MTQMVELTKCHNFFFTEINEIKDEKIQNKLAPSKSNFQNLFLIIFYLEIFFLKNIIYFQFRQLIYK